ncbi:MAG: hypothetical protein ACI4K7_06685 [Oscillospiraceae bacterium]
MDEKKVSYKELKSEFKLRNASAQTVENLVLIPFLICVVLAIFKLSVMWFIISIVFAIAQRMLHNMNFKKWQVYLKDNLYRLDVDDDIKSKIQF